MALQIEMNRANFPWLFDRRMEQTSLPKHNANCLRVLDSETSISRRRHSLQPTLEHSENSLRVPLDEGFTSRCRRSLQFNSSLPAEIIERHQSSRPPSRSPNRKARPLIAHSTSETSRKPPPWSSGQYIMPDLHDHIWILDADRGFGHLLVGRVDDRGTVLPPLVIFDGADWGHPQFHRLIRHEKKRHPSRVLWTFTFNISGKHYMWQSIFKDKNYFCNPRVQFCAILPLDLKDYKDELGKPRQEPHCTMEHYQLFKPLEKALAIPDLVSDLHHASDRGCMCGAPYNEYSPSMIRCDSPQCELEWYHKRCVDLDEEFETDEACICTECRRIPRRLMVAAKDTSLDLEAKLLEASDKRVHQTKTLVQVWDKHEWPKNNIILSLFGEISCRIDIDLGVISDIPEEGEPRGDKGCWALSKSFPERLMIVRPADNLDAEMDFKVGDVNAVGSHLACLALGGSARN
jgi:hypothetical protein